MPDESGFTAATPDDSPLTLADVLTSPVYLSLVAPTAVVGDQAPDFELPRVDAPRETVRLTETARNQPVALIFGSYT